MDTKDLYQAKRDMERRIADFIREQSLEFAKESGIGVKAVAVEFIQLPTIHYAFLDDPGERKLQPQSGSEEITAEVHLAI